MEGEFYEIVFEKKPPPRVATLRGMFVAVAARAKLPPRLQRIVLRRRCEARRWKSALGFLGYGNGREYEFHDCTLAHLKVVLAHRLRRRESFLLSWPAHGQPNGEAVSLWVAPNVPLSFRFDTVVATPLSQEWVSELMQRSYGPRGLVISSRELNGDTAR